MVCESVSTGSRDSLQITVSGLVDRGTNVV